MCGLRGLSQRYCILCRMIKGQKKEQIPFQALGDEKLVFNTLMAVFSKSSCQLWLIKKCPDLQAGSFHRMDQHPGETMDDLSRNTTH